MSKAFLASIIQGATETTKVAAKQAASDVVSAITTSLKQDGRFAIPGFGTFVVRRTKARMGHNPRTGESIKVAAGKTVRFKPSKSLKQYV